MIKSLLFIPSNSPRMLQSADVFESDAIIFDLEDAVSIDEKDSASNLLFNAFNKLSFNGKKVIRINDMSTPFYENDIKLINSLDIDYVLLPKSDIDSIKKLSNQLKNNIKIIALIESALGVEDAYLIAKETKVDYLFLGAEDLAVSLGVKRTLKGDEILYARTRIINAAKACNKEAIDTPFLDIENTNGLLNDTIFAKGIGFVAKAAINPKQVEHINKVFTPTSEEINEAELLLLAYEDAKKQKLGVFNYKGKMVDNPVIERAKQILKFK